MNELNTNNFDKLEEFIKYLTEDISVGTGIPVNILMGTAEPAEYSLRRGNNNTNYLVERGGMIPVPKEHPLDKRYPHECYLCKEELNWRGFLDRNLKVFTYTESIKDIKISESYKGVFGSKILMYTIFTKFNYQEYKRLKKLWRSPYIKFYCCNCYENL